MSLGAPSLKDEIGSLRAAIEALSLRAAELEERVDSLQASASGAAGSEAGFSLVSGQVESEPTCGSFVVDPTDHGARAQLAKELGQFLKAGLENRIAGPSGRDRLRLPSRYYIVVKDYGGRRLEEVICASAFGEIRDLVKREGHLGRSLFLGFPTLWEARTALREAGIPLPARLRDA